TLSALSTAGYAPDESEQIAYVKVPRDPRDVVGPIAEARTRNLRRNGPSLPKDGLLVPYEVARPDVLVEPGREPGPYGAVCVLWLGEDLGKGYDCEGKLDSLRTVKETLENALVKKAYKGTRNFVISGRLDSTQLAAILLDDGQKSPSAIVASTV